jgi:hypothetical protein
MPIIGYIHICQKPGWEKSFDILMSAIKKSNLYDSIEKIRCGVLNDSGEFSFNERLCDPKIKIIHIGKSEEFEHPTLLHMKKLSEIDPEDTKYFYLHTKGLRHFETKREEFVLDWINTLLYWNIEKWELAVDKLNEYNAYGCYCNQYYNNHYCGNFWWATANHVKKLPNYIDTTYYNGAEDWVLKINDNRYCAHNYTSEWFENMMKMYKDIA